MSTSEIDPNLQEHIDNTIVAAMQLMKQEADKDRKKEFDALMMGLKEELEPIQVQLSKHEGWIATLSGNSGQVQQEQAPRQNPMAALQGNPIVEKILDKLASKYLGDEDPASDTDFMQYKENVHALYKLGIKRAIQATDVLIKRELRQPSRTTANIAANMIEGDLSDHKPL